MKSNSPKNKNRLCFAILILLGMVLPGREAVAKPAAETAIAKPVVVKYEQLLTAIREAKAKSRERVEALVVTRPPKLKPVEKRVSGW